jgi:hypothetical protein
MREPLTLRQYLDLGENILATDLRPRERKILEQRWVDMKAVVETSTRRRCRHGRKRCK